MDYYNSKLKNPKINGKELIRNGNVNPDICLNSNLIVAGEGIFISNNNGMVTISLDTNRIRAITYGNTEGNNN